VVAGLFLFGPKKLPELGKGLAQGIRGFKDGLNGAEKPAEKLAEKPDEPSGV
jgi:sec-independent protein translocase protein TatA